VSSTPTAAPPESIDLGDRLLWADGVSTVKPERLVELLYRVPVAKLATSEITPDVEAFNRISDVKIQVKTCIDLTLFPPQWILPEKYKYFSLDKRLVELTDLIEHDDLYEERIDRLSQEIFLFNELGLGEVLRALIYVVDRMKEVGAVWGVGRGSSCSSYLLYLLDLHCVDPVRYDIQITDFIKIEE